MLNAFFCFQFSLGFPSFYRPLPWSSRSKLRFDTTPCGRELALAPNMNRCIAISITNVIHIQKHNRQTQIHRRLRCSDTNIYKLLDFWVRFLDTRGERDTHLNHSILTKLKRSAHLVVSSISVGRDPQNSTVRLQLLNTMVLTSTLDMAKVNSQLDWPQSSTQLDWPTVKLNWTGPQ